MDSNSLSLIPSRQWRGMSWFLILCVFPCWSALISLPISGVYIVYALFPLSSWADIATLSLKVPVVFVGLTLGLTFIGCVAEVVIAVLRWLRNNVQGRQTIPRVEKGLYVELYFRLAVIMTFGFVMKLERLIGSSPV